MKIRKILSNYKIYEFIKIRTSKNLVMAIIIGDGIKIVMINVKKQSYYEIFWMRNATKIR